MHSVCRPCTSNCPLVQKSTYNRLQQNASLCDVTLQVATCNIMIKLPDNDYIMPTSNVAAVIVVRQNAVIVFSHLSISPDPLPPPQTRTFCQLHSIDHTAFHMISSKQAWLPIHLTRLVTLFICMTVLFPIFWTSMHP